jgi:hypothetical protein
LVICKGSTAIKLSNTTAIPGMNFPEVPNAIPIDKMYRMISQFAAKEGHNFREVWQYYQIGEFPSLNLMVSHL